MFGKKASTVSAGDRVNFSNGVSVDIVRIYEDEDGEDVARVNWNAGAISTFINGSGGNENLDEIESWFDKNEKPEAELMEGGAKSKWW